MIAEPVQGAGGVAVPPDGYWQAVREALDKHGILLIADEVINGFGRTGKMFGQQTSRLRGRYRLLRQGHHLGLYPAGRFGGLGRDLRTMSSADRMFMHGFTYSGHPVACAVALRNIQIIEDEDLATNAGSAATRSAPSCTSCSTIIRMSATFAASADDPGRDGRGQGTKAKYDPALRMGDKLTMATRDKGIIVRCNNDGVAFAPPLTLTVDEAQTVAQAAAAAIEEILV